MGKNNYYPIYDLDQELPVYVFGIGVGHAQEEKNHYNPPKRILLHLTITGCGIAEIDGKRHMLTPGTLLITPPGKNLSIAPTPLGWTDNWIGLHIESLTPEMLKAMNLSTEPMLLRPQNPGRLAEIYTNVSRLLTTKTIQSRFEAAAEGYKLLVQAISAAILGTEPPTTSESRIVLCLTSYIDDHLDEKLTLVRLGEVSGNLSRQYLCRIFKKQTGLTIGDYILEHRIAKAKDLLTNTDLSIGEIAVMIGLESESYFYRSWKRTESDSPSEYRRTHRNLFV